MQFRVNWQRIIEGLASIKCNIRKGIGKLEGHYPIYTIEIKSSKNYTTSSLDNLKKKYPQLKIKKYVFGIKHGKFEEDKVTLPIYSLLFL